MLNVDNNTLTERTSKYLAYNPIPEVLAKLTSNQQTSAATRSKAIYCISNTLRHSARAVQGFEAHGGWGVLKAAIQGSYGDTRRRSRKLTHPHDRFKYSCPTQSGILTAYSLTTRRPIVYPRPYSTPAINSYDPRGAGAGRSRNKHRRRSEQGNRVIGDITKLTPITCNARATRA